MKRNRGKIDRPLFMKKGGGGGKSSDTKQTTVPWGPQQPYLKDLFARAQTELNKPGPHFFPSSTVAGFTPLQWQGQRMAVDAARGGLTDLGQSAAGANNFLLGDVLNPESNPYLQRSVDAALGRTTRAFNEDVLPGIRSSFVGAGQGGSTRHAIAEGIAMDRLQQNMGNTAASMYSQAYNQGLDAMLRGVALSPQTGQMLMTPSGVVSAVGADQQAMKQAQLSDEVNRWNFEQNAPWNELTQYGQLISGGFGGTSTTSAPSPERNPFMGAAGGALSGAALAKMVGGPVGWGAGIGALIGIL